MFDLAANSTMDVRKTPAMVIAGYLVLVVLTWTAAGFELTIVHNNDVHAHFDEIDNYYGECDEDESADQACYGGEARRNWFIKGTLSFLVRIASPCCLVIYW